MAREFFNCECHTEGLIVEMIDNDIYLAMWSLGKYGDRLSFLNRVRWCWNILLHGLPWVDGVILHKKETKRFIKSLQKQYRKLK